MEDQEKVHDEEDARAEWIPPSVQDIDMEAVTLSGGKSSGSWDSTSYS